MSGLGLYVHIPFCARICPYCTFASVAGEWALHDRYVEAVCREIELAGERAAGSRLATIFFGGGTPSLMSASQLARILDAAEARLGLDAGAEVTVEVNPGTADCSWFRSLRQIGCNRLSLGVQSFRDQALEKLGRAHSAAEAETAYEMARRAGFDNVSFDLIFSIPGVALESWVYTLERAIALDPEHISTYALTIEEGTDFARRLNQALLEPVDEEEDAQTYEWTCERLIRAGYDHYEVSNFARPGRHSRHNWGYWTRTEYLGVGLAAHSFLAGRRSWNTSDLPEYIQAIEEGRSPCAGWEDIDPQTQVREQVWMGLRTSRGIALEEEASRVLSREPRFRDLLESGHFEFRENRLRLTRSGFALADALGIEVAYLLETAFPASAGRRGVER